MTVANLMTDSSWFFPSLTLYKWLSLPGYTMTFVGQESKYGVDVLHVAVSLTASTFPPDMAATFQHESRTEVYLDSSSGLPVALGFNIHPDKNDLLDIPVEIHFSDYRSANGIQVPFHVERYLNGGLILDLHFDTVTLNSGVSTSDFQIQ